MRKGNKLITAICYIALILVVVGVVGFILKLTNGGTDEFKFFYVMDEDDNIYASNDSETVSRISETKFKVKYTFIANEEYSVKVVPNITDETNFEYTVDGSIYQWADDKELNFTSAFAVEVYEDYFTLKMPEKMQDVLGFVYEGQTVSLSEDIDLCAYPYFTLVVTSYNGNNEIVIQLQGELIYVDKVEFNEENFAF